MKLFLHWLRWDLRHFSIALWQWVLGLFCFYVFAGFLNHDLQSSAREMSRWTAPCALFLLLCETFLLLRLFSTDPAMGTEVFWKTRPPSGWAVALSKVVIALVFFLGLPLFGWWLVLTITGNGAEMLSNGERVDRVTWMQRLWWAQGLLLSACLIAGSVSGHDRSIWLRAITVVAIFLLAAAIRSWWEKGTLFPQTAWHSQPPLLWLLVGLSLFLIARLRRTPSGLAGRFTLVFPGLLAMGGAAMPFLPTTGPSFTKEKELAPEFSSLLRVGNPLIKTGFRQGISINRDSDAGICGFPISLHLEGLANDYRASGFWQEISLTTPDGRRIPGVSLEERMQHLQVERPTGWGGTSQAVTSTGALFLERDLAGLGLVRCRLEGTLRLWIYKRREQSWPLSLGKVMQGPAGHIRIDSVASDMAQNQSAGYSIISGAILESEATEEAWWWIKHRDHGVAIPFGMRKDAPVIGWSVEPKMNFFRKSAEFRGIEELPSLRLRRAAALGKLSEWNFHVGWYETLGFMDVPISAREFVVPPRGSADTTPDRITALFPKLPHDATPEEVRSALHYGSHFHELSIGFISERELFPSLLAEIPERHLPVLQEFLQREFAFTDELACDLLESRVNVITKGVPWPKADPDIKTDEDLHAAWLRGGKSASQALGEATKRGLSLVPEAISELATYPKDSINHLIAPALIEFEKLSNFPQEDSTRTDRAWLLANGANIRWDAAIKRWVLP